MFDLWYFVVLAPALILSVLAQIRVKSAFAKYSGVRTDRGMSGAEVARAILHAERVEGIRIEESHGWLSDHYNPLNKTLALSADVFHGRSVAAAGVAAHEVGHAIQHARAFWPLKARSLLVMPATIGSSLGIWVIVAAMLLGGAQTATGWNLGIAGLVIFGAATVFTLITLPVEFDASSRAVRVLVDGGLVTRHESDGVRAVLNAAALTYLAAALSSVLTLLYYAWRLGLFGGGRDRD